MLGWASRPLAVVMVLSLIACGADESRTAEVNTPTGTRTDQLAPGSAEDPSPLLALWNEQNRECRGGSGDQQATLLACDKREQTDARLRAVGWCYGENAMFGCQTEWRPCGEPRYPSKAAAEAAGCPSAPDVAALPSPTASGPAMTEISRVPATPRRFDLECVGPDALLSVPFEARYSVDLEAGEWWCSAGCASPLTPFVSRSSALWVLEDDDTFRTTYAPNTKRLTTIIDGPYGRTPLRALDCSVGDFTPLRAD